MFKKLKDKLAEEISPQRIQQLTQSVTERLQNSVDSSVFSIAEDDTSSAANDAESNFTNVNLNYPKRRNSNTSIASDVSFLPRYETNFNPYHLQSDLDISASEIEDNASSSSQLGHVSKEQVHSAFQKAQMRYHKYRGRYTDLANHYKELEKENSKMKSVLVDQQDKAIRRMSELREQCSLSQKAKADLEQALRTEIEEKQIIISTLKDKIDLLQNQTPKNDNSSEINELKEKIEELKATSIISQSRENENKEKITNLEKQLGEKQSELAAIEEREQGNNLKFATGKKELHEKLENKETEINNLRIELEANKKVNDTNLKSQNSKLIEKNETLLKKCRDYESDLVKMEQYCLEINELKSERSQLKQKLELQEINLDQSEDIKTKLLNLQEENFNLIKQIEIVNNNSKETEKANGNLRKSLQETVDSEKLAKEQFEVDRKKIQDATKESLLKLESRIKATLLEEFKVKENKLTADFECKIQELQKDDSATKQLQLKIGENRTEINELNELVVKYKGDFERSIEEYKASEIERLQLIDMCKKCECEIIDLKNELEESHLQLSKSVGDFQDLSKSEQDCKSKIINLAQENAKLKNHASEFEMTCKNLQNEVDLFNQEKVGLNNEIKSLALEIENLRINLERSEVTCRELQSIVEAKTEELVLSRKKLLESDDLLKNLENNMKQNNEELNNVLENTKRDLENLKETNKNLKLEIDSLTSENAVLIEKCASYEKLVNEFNVNIKPCFEEQIDNLNKKLLDLNDLENKYKSSIDENSKLKETIMKLEDFNNNIKPNLQSQINDLNQQIDELKIVENNYKLVLNENSSLKEKLEDFNKNNKTELDDLNRKVEKLNDLENKFKEASEENYSLKEEIGKLQDFMKNTKPGLELQISGLNQQIEDLKDIESKYKGVLDENDNLKKEILQLEELHAKIETLNKENEVKIKKIAETNAEKQKLHTELKALETYKNQNAQLTEEISQMRITLDNLSSQNQASAEKHKILKSIEKQHKETLIEKQGMIEKLTLLENEITELNSRNTQVSSDNRQLVQENENLIEECAEYKLKYENFNSFKTKLEETIETLKNTNNKLTADYEALSIDYKNLGEQFQKLQSCQMPSNDLMTDLQTKFLEITEKYEQILEENKNFKSEVAKNGSELQNIIVEKKKVETLLRDMEHNCTELSHERQLLKDEIVELKTAPINVHNDSDKRAREIENLREKLEHYKSIDLTNRSSIEFYESELQKMRNKNEKINRKLDETLVTLNHCADLSENTEIEYLKNVLYNYMLGKESLVMARVIAAVCKFDSHQTDAVLKHEQHKQSILGQLGIL